MAWLQFGDIAVDRVIENEGPGFMPDFFLPDSTEEGLAGEMDWLAPRVIDPETGKIIRAIQSFVIKTDHHTILVEACVGNDKERPSTPPWHMQKTSWLQDLAELGVHPDNIDMVLCTHLHADHVGWNTKLENGRWVPTFPNAKYLFHKDEYKYWKEQGQELEGPGSADGSIEDSVLPIMEAGQAVLVEGDHAIDDRLVLDPTPGHSPGHVCLNLNAGGQRAVFAGDTIHHAVQCAYPEWNSRFCIDKEQSRQTRTKFVKSYADQDVLIIPTHFPTPTAGHIVGNGDRCKFIFSGER